MYTTWNYIFSKAVVRFDGILYSAEVVGCASRCFPFHYVIVSTGSQSGTLQTIPSVRRVQWHYNGLICDEIQKFPTKSKFLGIFYGGAC